jgi:hypothetical protein
LSAESYVTIVPGTGTFGQLYSKNVQDAHNFCLARSISFYLYVILPAFLQPAPKIIYAKVPITGQRGTIWRQYQSLSKRFQVIAVSTRGHGKSELGTMPFSYKQRANDVLAVIKAVKMSGISNCRRPGSVQ